MTERKPEYFRNYRPITINWFTGWWLSLPLWKYESQLGLLFPIYGKNAKCSKPPTSFKWFKYKRENEKFLTFGRDLATLWGVISQGPPAIATAARKKCEAGAKELCLWTLGHWVPIFFNGLVGNFKPETRKPGILPKLCRGDFLWFPLYMFSSTNSGKFAVVICGYHRENRELKLQNPVRISMQPQWGDGKSKPLHSISKPERTWLSFIGVPRNDHPGKRSKKLPRFPRHFLVSLHVVSGAQSCDVQMVFACQLVVGGLEKHWKNEVKQLFETTISTLKSWLEPSTWQLDRSTRLHEKIQTTVMSSLDKPS